jgi:hypothetical protein
MHQRHDISNEVELTLCHVPSEMANTIQRMKHKWSRKYGFTAQLCPFGKLMDEIDDMARVEWNSDNGSSKVSQEEGIQS